MNVATRILVGAAPLAMIGIGVAAIREVGKGPSTDTMIRQVEDLDADDSESIDRDEAVTTVTREVDSRYADPGTAEWRTDATKLLEAADANGDDVATFDEIRELHQAWDPDGDGHVLSSEWRKNYSELIGTRVSGYERFGVQDD